MNICKFSECGTLLAASSVYGEIIVWNVQSKVLVGYTEHQQNTKITALSWNIDQPDEIAFCDSLGQLGCVDVASIFVLVRFMSHVTYSFFFFTCSDTLRSTPEQ